MGSKYNCLDTDDNYDIVDLNDDTYSNLDKEDGYEIIHNRRRSTDENEMYTD